MRRTLSSLPRPRWQYRELVVALGSDDEVAQLIRAAGYNPPPVKTVAGWRARNSVSAKWAPLLIDFAIKRKILPGVAALRGRS